MADTIAFLVQKMALLTACLFLIFVAWEDFRKFRVRNASVLVLLGIYAVFAIARGELQPVLQDFYGGLLLFLLGVAFWLAKLMGAGDAKLFFPVGCWVSLHNLFSWSVLLLVCSIILLALVKLPFPLGMRHLAVIDRLDELRRGKKVPYAVPISISTVILVLPNVFL
jgi:prepilin peptidase CpaA